MEKLPKLDPVLVSDLSFKPVVLAVNLLWCAWIRKFSHNFNRHISSGLLSLTMSVVLAMYIYLVPQKYHVPFKFYFLQFHPELYLSLLQPIHIIFVALALDTHLAFKCLPAAILMGTIGMLLFAICFGFTIQAVMFSIGSKWLFILGYGACAASTELTPALINLMSVSDPLNANISLLAVETIITVSHSIFVVTVVMGMANKIITQWFHLACLYIRNIGGGIVFGLLFGRLASRLMRRTLNSLLLMITVLLSMAYGVYYFCEKMLFVSGTVATFIVALYIGKARFRLSFNDQKRLTIFLLLFHEGINVYVTIQVIGFLISDSASIFEAIYILSFCICYALVVLARSVSFLVVIPLLLRHRFLLNGVFFVVRLFSRCGLIQLLLVSLLYFNPKTHEMMHHTCIQMMIVIYVQVLVYDIALRHILGRLKLGARNYDKATLLAFCTETITRTGKTFLNAMRMDKHLGDANWEAIEKAREINLQLSKGGKQEAVKLRAGVTDCMECTNAESKTFRRESPEKMLKLRQKLLQIQKASVIRQFELGVLSPKPYKYILHAINTALRSKTKRLDVDTLLTLNHKETTLDSIRRFILELNATKIEMKKARVRWHRNVQILVTSRIYEIFIYIIILASIFAYAVCFLHYLKWMTPTLLAFYAIFLLDITLRIISYWHIEFKQGLRAYLSDNWNVFDVLLLGVNTVELAWSVVLYMGFLPNVLAVAIYMSFTQARNLRLLKFIHIIYQARGILLTKCNNRIFNRNVLSAHVAQGLVTTWSDLNHKLPSIVDNPRVRNDLQLELAEYISKGNAERWRNMRDISRHFFLLERIFITMKTDRVITSVHKAMTSTLETFKTLGFTDNFEYYELKRQLNSLKESVLVVPLLRLPLHKLYFTSVPFFENSKETDFLFDKAMMVTFKPNDKIIGLGEDSGGIYIITEGLASLNYKVDNETLANLSRHAALPIKDYLTDINFAKPTHHFIYCGNCIGIQSVLSKRKSDCEIRAVVTCKAYFISESHINQLILNSEDLANGLYSRLWKYVTVNLAITLLWKSPSYLSMDFEDVCFFLEKGFVPKTTELETIFFTDAIEDVILIEGKVLDEYTKILYSAPYCLPRTVRKITFIRKTGAIVEPKIFVVPIKAECKYCIVENYFLKSQSTILRQDSQWSQSSAHLKKLF